MSYSQSEIKSFYNQKTPIISYTCTETNVYIATKTYISGRSINYNLIEKTSMQKLPNKTCLNIYSFSVDGKTDSKNTIILVKTDSNFLAVCEDTFGRDAWTPIDLEFNYNKYVHFAPFKRGSLGVFVDSQNIYLHSFSIAQKLDPSNDHVSFHITSTKVSKPIPHRLKDPIDVLSTADTICIYNKKGYKIFNSKLDELLFQPISKPFRCVTPIIGNNSYCAIQDNNTLIQLYDDRKLIREEIKFPEVVISLQVKLPYICAISQKNFMYFLTVSSIENNIFPLPRDMKTKFPALLTMCKNNYSLFYASDDTLWSIKYSKKHDQDYLTNQRKWDQLVEMNILMNSDLDDFYYSMAKNMFAKREYVRAFEAFKKSRKSPFKLLGQFTRKNSELKEEAKKDADQRIGLLQILRDKVLNHSKPSEIEEALDNVYEQSHMKDKPKNLQDVNETLIENEIADSNKVKEQILDLVNTPKIDDQSGSVNVGVYNPLQEYISQLLVSEHNPTRIKIYNTILCEIYAKTGMILPMETLIKNESPVFFKMAYAELDSMDANPSIFALCEQYHQHEIAIKTAEKSNSYEQLISYVSKSRDCLDLAPGLLKQVFQYYCEDKNKGNGKNEDRGKQKMAPNLAAKKAAALFFSYNISPDSDETEKVLQIIDSKSLKQDPRDTKDYKEEVKEAFLNFVVFSLHSKSNMVHSQLCNLYIKKLNKLNKIDYRKKYVNIAGEKDSDMKQTRESLFKLLSESDYYEPHEVIRELPDIYLEEKIAAYLKINTRASLEDCIELVVVPTVPIEIAVTKFCDMAYDSEDSDRNGIYNLLFSALIREYNNNKNDSAKKAEYMKRIKYLLNERAQFLNPDQVIENIPKDIPITELKQFFDDSSTPRINRLRLLEIQNALYEETIKQKKNQIQYLKAGKVVVTKGLKCIVCGKSIDESVFYVRNDSTVAHAACNPSHDE